MKRPPSPRQPVPRSPRQSALFDRAVTSFRAGRDAEAERLLRKLLKHTPETPQALHLLGLIAARNGRSADAERLLRRCVAAAPGDAEAHNNLGNALMARGQLAEAEASYRRAAQLAPSYPLPRYNRGRCLHAQGRLADAEAAYRGALAVAPDYVDAQVNLGNLMREQGAYDQAEGMYRQVLERHPDLHEVRLNIGNIHRLRGELGHARTEYETLLRAVPGHPRVRLSLALTLLAEHRVEQAQALIDEAEHQGNAPVQEVLAARARMHAVRGDRRGALETLVQAVAAGADGPEYAFSIAELLSELGQHAQARDILERSRARFGERPPGLAGLLLSNQARLCDWTQWQARVSALVARVRRGAPQVTAPFSALSLPGLQAPDLLAVARDTGAKYQDWMRRGPLCRRTSDRSAHERLRIGYLSSDLRQHATATLTAAVFELHDRRRFEVFGYAIGPADDSAMRRRLRRGFEHFTELQDLSHEQAARRICADGIDVLVDLNGYTRHARPEILAMRPAPLQVNWLGFPGSMGVPFMDYLIADAVVVPPDQAEHYAESIAYLPDAYMPFDFRRQAAPRPTRAEVDLPEDAFVFCCFNNPYKLTPGLFGHWCDLLAELPNSVLWLPAFSDEVHANLAKAAAAAGLGAGRLVFAERRPHDEHQVRLALADLFLDTWPYNAHTTAADALWAGVPVLTCPGATFPSRVAASLALAVGLPELVCHDVDDYLRQARRLATDPAALALLRQRLIDARATAPLFDSARFTRALEALYRRMWQRWVAGLPPAQLPAEPAAAAARTTDGGRHEERAGTA